MSALDWHDGGDRVIPNYPVAFDEDGDALRFETATAPTHIARGDRATYLVAQLPKLDLDTQVEFMEFGLGPWLTLAVDTTADDPRGGAMAWLSPTFADATARAEDHEKNLP